LDVVDFVESDPRVQVVFTVAPSAFNHCLPGYLTDLGALVLPWEQATRERFDLGLAAAYNQLSEVHAPLIVMGHGAGHGKLTRPRTHGGPGVPRPPVYGLDPGRLAQDGRVLATAIVLSHEGEREILRRQCPEALGAAVVAGDPCFDRLVASLPSRASYRAALGVEDGDELVTVTSTWGREGLFGHAPDLLPRIMDQLPRNRFRVAALLHPAVWSAHGSRQIRSWLRDCRDAGLILLDPVQDWRALTIAADHVIGDHGSVTAYSAAIGKPVLHLTAEPIRRLNPASAQALVLRNAGRFDPDRPVLPQLRAATRLDPTAVTAALTSRPGQADRTLRRIMYRLLRLTEPGRHRRPTPVPVPRIVRGADS
jgi:hypothetical protein